MPPSALVSATELAFAFPKLPQPPRGKGMEAMDSSGLWARVSAANLESDNPARTRKDRHGMLSGLDILDCKGEVQVWILECLALWRR